MHTRNLLRTLPRYLLAAALAAGVATTGLYAVDGDPPGLFELDGDTAPSATWPGDDWDNVFLENLTIPPVANTGILPDEPIIVGNTTSDPSIFTQGTADTDDVSEWSYTSGNVPDKNQITNAYALGYTLPDDVSYDGLVVHHQGDLVIYFGLDRYANNGDAQTGFWFFQQDVAPDGNGGFTGEHTARTISARGDLLVLVDYPQGANAIPVIRVLEWDPDDVDGDGNVANNLDELYNSSDPGSLPATCDGDGNKLVCAITNHENLPGAPEWPYTPKKIGPTVFDGIPSESFFEGGINVSALLGGEVPCFSSFLAETRASASETAELKDWVLGNFDLCDISVTKNCEAEVNDEDGGNSVVVNFSGEVENTGALALEVTVTDDMGTPGDTGDDQVVFGPATLQPGETQPYSSNYTTTDVTPSDTVTAVGQRGEASVSATADASCEALVNPAIAVTKVCTATLKGDGSGVDVLFNGIVTNTGNVALEDVTVVDDNGTPGDTLDDVTINLGKIDAGDSAPYNGGFGVTGSNTSTDHVVASGTDVLTGVEVSDSAQVSCSADVHPAILVTKLCSATINTGGTGIDVTFNGTVSNTGDVILENVTVVDDNGTPGNPGDDVPLIEDATLAVGASLPFNGGFAASGNSSTDVVTATGEDALTSAPVLDTETASCGAEVTPQLVVTKQCTDATAFDQPILFDGTVTNTGNVALLGVIVVDDNGTPADPSDDVTFPIGDLAPNGGTANYNGSYSPGPGTFTNTVVAGGSDAILSSPVSSSPASATCEVPPPPDFEGCTPGFWKNSPGSWVGYSPNQLVGSVFSLPNGVLANQLGDDTLMEALNYPGGNNLLGAAQILLRAAVASLLNAAHPDVDFPRTEQEVIDAVNAALATGDRATILALASALDADNNLGCDLANDNSF
jgi:hypothetical protein